MFTFIIAIVILVVGYFIYGTYIARIVEINPQNPTPALTRTDGIDFVPMPTWKVFMIQFLNIAGLGPIFGAIMGAQFGTASYLWIVFGTIFGGAVHDFISGIMSLRNNGESLPQLIGRYLGENVKKVMIVLVLLFLTLAGAVFVSQPANIIVVSLNAPEAAAGSASQPFYLNVYFWVAVIFCYYLVATLFPIDKIIGKIYPIFAICLFLMAIVILAALLVRWPALPEIWDGFGTKYDPSPIFPMMFVSIACGAVSGSHATRSPLMARCLKNEKHAKPVFYGAMVAEGIVAPIWAAAATAFYQDVTISFILEAPTGAYIAGKGLTPWIAQSIAAVATITLVAWFYRWMKIRKMIGIGM